MKILVADDHPLFRSGLRQALLQLGENVTILEADGYTDACKLADRHCDLTLVLLDLYMPSDDGLEALGNFIDRFPALPVVVLSAADDRYVMQRAFDLGIFGFVHKSTAQSLILSALRLVLDGGRYIPPAFLDFHPSVDAKPSVNDLTQRQSEVLDKVIEGKSNKAIAREMGLTEATVKTHVAHAFKTLKVANRTQAAMAISKFRNS